MKSPSTVELLQLWEEGANQSLLQKTLRLLAASYGVADYHEMGQLSVGERDLRLLQLRESLFGRRMNNMADCPACGQIAEWQADTRTLQLQELSAEISNRTFLLEAGTFSILYRLPDSADIARINSGSLCVADRRHLIADCILEVNGGAGKPALESLPDSVWNLIEQQMEQHDPQADINIELSCESCGHSWLSWFDIVSYLWTEINAWALRCLQEVHTLAKSFGWSERDILSMNPRRRQLYLQMLGAS